MNKLLLFFVLLPILTIAQTGTIHAELIDYSSDKIPAYCGYQTEWGVLKFRIVKSNNALKNKQVILVLFQCPRETMENNIGIDFYKNNQEYIITIGDKIEKNKIPERVSVIYENNSENDILMFPLRELKEIQ